MRGSIVQMLEDFLRVSWNAFVAVFLYYTALVLLVLSGLDLSAGFVAASYGLPVLAYAVLLLTRAGSGVARMNLAPLRLQHALAR